MGWQIKRLIENKHWSARGQQKKKHESESDCIVCVSAGRGQLIHYSLQEDISLGYVDDFVNCFLNPRRTSVYLWSRRYARWALWAKCGVLQKPVSQCNELLLMDHRVQNALFPLKRRLSVWIGKWRIMFILCVSKTATWLWCNVSLKH